MKKTTVFSNFNLRLGEILEGEEITEEDEIFLDKITEEANTIPDKVINNLKKDYSITQECLADYAGATLPDSNNLFDAPEEYDINDFEMLYESPRPSIGVLRKSLIKNLLILFKDSAIEVNGCRQIIDLQKLYINYLKEKVTNLEKSLEKSSNVSIDAKTGTAEQTVIIKEEEEDGTR